MSWLGGVIAYLNEIGLYDVVLPFLLVFTITFAILEKTKILGTEIINGTEYPRRNLNSMVALVIGLVVVTATRIIAIMNKFLSMVALVMVVGIGFLLMIGVFYQPKDKDGKNQPLLSKKWVQFLTIVIAIVSLFIILSALGWLSKIYSWIVTNICGQVIGSIVLLGLIILFIVYITKPENTGSNSEDND